MGKKTSDAAKSIRKAFKAKKKRKKMSLGEAFGYIKDKAKENVNDRRRKSGVKEY